MTGSSDPDLIVVVADDLSGAVDTAAAWKAGHGGAACVVAPWTDSPESPVEQCWDRLRADTRPSLLSISTGSRNLPADEASSRVRRAMDWACDLGATRVKKVDSLLRGNVIEEISAFINASPATAFLFAPALPAQGRITLQGVQLVEGHEVSHTAAREEDLAPIQSSRLEDLLPEEIPRVSVRLDELRAGDARELTRKALDSAGVVIADALSMEDLVALRSGAFDAGADLIGTSGLMSSLSPDPPHTLSAEGASEVVTTSRRWEVEEQLDQLSSRMRDSTHVVVHASHLPTIDELAAAMRAGARTSSVCMVSLSRSEAVDADPRRRAGMSELIVFTIAEAVASLMVAEGAEAPSLVILGGDLAEGVALRCGVTALEVLGQTADGGGLCRPLDGIVVESKPWVVRSGAFGESGALIRLFAWSRTNRRHL